MFSGLETGLSPVWNPGFAAGLEVGFLAEAEGWVSETAQCLLLERADPGWAEFEVPAYFLMGTRKAIFETNTFREDVRLTISDTVDCFTQCVDRRHTPVLCNRAVLATVGHEVAEYKHAQANACPPTPPRWPRSDFG